MLTKQEKQLIHDRSLVWNGPNVWGWDCGYRLSLQEVIKQSEFG